MQRKPSLWRRAAAAGARVVRGVAPTGIATRIVGVAPGNPPPATATAPVTPPATVGRTPVVPPAIATATAEEKKAEAKAAETLRQMTQDARRATQIATAMAETRPRPMGTAVATKAAEAMQETVREATSHGIAALSAADHSTFQFNKNLIAQYDRYLPLEPERKEHKRPAENKEAKREDLPGYIRIGQEMAARLRAAETTIRPLSYEQRNAILADAHAVETAVALIVAEENERSRRNPSYAPKSMLANIRTIIDIGNNNRAILAARQPVLGDTKRTTPAAAIAPLPAAPNPTVRAPAARTTPPAATRQADVKTEVKRAAAPADFQFTPPPTGSTVTPGQKTRYGMLWMAEHVAAKCKEVEVDARAHEFFDAQLAVVKQLYVTGGNMDAARRSLDILLEHLITNDIAEIRLSPDEDKMIRLELRASIDFFNGLRDAQLTAALETAERFFNGGTENIQPLAVLKNLHDRVLAVDPNLFNGRPPFGLAIGTAFVNLRAAAAPITPAPLPPPPRVYSAPRPIGDAGLPERIETDNNLRSLIITARNIASHAQTGIDTEDDDNLQNAVDAMRAIDGIYEEKGVPSDPARTARVITQANIIKASIEAFNRTVHSLSHIDIADLTGQLNNLTPTVAAGGPAATPAPAIDARGLLRSGATPQQGIEANKLAQQITDYYVQEAIRENEERKAPAVNPPRVAAPGSTVAMGRPPQTDARAKSDGTLQLAAVQAREAARRINYFDYKHNPPTYAQKFEDDIAILRNLARQCRLPSDGLNAAPTPATVTRPDVPVAAAPDPAIAHFGIATTRAINIVQTLALHYARVSSAQPPPYVNALQNAMTKMIVIRDNYTGHPDDVRRFEENVGVFIHNQDKYRGISAPPAATPVPAAAAARVALARTEAARAVAEATAAAVTIRTSAARTVTRAAALDPLAVGAPSSRPAIPGLPITVAHAPPTAPAAGGGITPEAYAIHGQMWVINRFVYEITQAYYNGKPGVELTHATDAGHIAAHAAAIASDLSITEAARYAALDVERHKLIAIAGRVSVTVDPLVDAHILAIEAKELVDTLRSDPAVNRTIVAEAHEHANAVTAAALAGNHAEADRRFNLIWNTFRGPTNPAGVATPQPLLLRALGRELVTPPANPIFAPKTATPRAPVAAPLHALPPHLIPPAAPASPADIAAYGAAWDIIAHAQILAGNAAVKDRAEGIIIQAIGFGNRGTGSGSPRTEEMKNLKLQGPALNILFGEAKTQPSPNLQAAEFAIAAAANARILKDNGGTPDEVKRAEDNAQRARNAAEAEPLDLGVTPLSYFEGLHNANIRILAGKGISLRASFPEAIGNALLADDPLLRPFRNLVPGPAIAAPSSGPAAVATPAPVAGATPPSGPAAAKAPGAIRRPPATLPVLDATAEANLSFEAKLARAAHEMSGAAYHARSADERRHTDEDVLKQKGAEWAEAPLAHLGAVHDELKKINEAKLTDGNIDARFKLVAKALVVQINRGRYRNLSQDDLIRVINNALNTAHTPKSRDEQAAKELIQVLLGGKRGKSINPVDMRKLENIELIAEVILKTVGELYPQQRLLLEQVNFEESVFYQRLTALEEQIVEDPANGDLSSLIMHRMKAPILQARAAVGVMYDPRYVSAGQAKIASRALDDISQEHKRLYDAVDIGKIAETALLQALHAASDPWTPTAPQETAIYIAGVAAGYGRAYGNLNKNEVATLAAAVINNIARAGYDDVTNSRAVAHAMAEAAAKAFIQAKGDPAWQALAAQEAAAKVYALAIDAYNAAPLPHANRLKQANAVVSTNDTVEQALQYANQRVDLAKEFERCRVGALPLPPGTEPVIAPDSGDAGIIKDHLIILNYPDLNNRPSAAAQAAHVAGMKAKVDQIKADGLPDLKDRAEAAKERFKFTDIKTKNPFMVLNNKRFVDVASPDAKMMGAGIVFSASSAASPEKIEKGKTYLVAHSKNIDLRINVGNDGSVSYDPTARRHITNLVSNAASEGSTKEASYALSAFQLVNGNTHTAWITDYKSAKNVMDAIAAAEKQKAILDVSAAVAAQFRLDYGSGADKILRELRSNNRRLAKELKSAPAPAGLTTPITPAAVVTPITPAAVVTPPPAATVFNPATGGMGAAPIIPAVTVPAPSRGGVIGLGGTTTGPTARTAAGAVTGATIGSLGGPLGALTGAAVGSALGAASSASARGRLATLTAGIAGALLAGPPGGAAAAAVTAIAVNALASRATTPAASPAVAAPAGAHDPDPLAQPVPPPSRGGPRRGSSSST